METTLHYQIRRIEFLKWSFIAFFKQLWLLHIVMLSFFLVKAFPIYERSDGNIFQLLLACVVFFVFYMVAMLLILQITFKAKMRTLIVAPKGIHTEIGNKVGDAAWSDIQSITDKGDHVLIMRKNLNFFTVPTRAFADEKAKFDFLSRVNSWMKNC
jgi:hypothetical protein